MGVLRLRRCGCPEADLPVSVGLTEGEANVYPGQGSANAALVPVVPTSVRSVLLSALARDRRAPAPQTFPSVMGVPAGVSVHPLAIHVAHDVPLSERLDSPTLGHLLEVSFEGGIMERSRDFRPAMPLVFR